MSDTPNGLYILGFGGHARSVADVAVSVGWGDILFIDANARDGERFGDFEVVRELPADLQKGWLAFPAAGDNRRRNLQVRAATLPFATLISPRATIGLEAAVGTGTLVCHGAHIGPGASIGAGVILNTHSVVEHEAQIGDFTHVSVNATVAGRAKIGRGVMLGAGSVVIDSVTICDDVVIGAGAVVVADIVETGTYVGVPARKTKTGAADRHHRPAR